MFCLVFSVIATAALANPTVSNRSVVSKHSSLESESMCGKTEIGVNVNQSRSRQRAPVISLSQIVG